MTTKKPIAYGNGTQGGVYHVECWYKHADEYYKGRLSRAFLGTIYYPGAERKELKSEKCALCGIGFSVTHSTPNP
jgi:hypothetical protein